MLKRVSLILLGVVIGLTVIETSFNVYKTIKGATIKQGHNFNISKAHYKINIFEDKQIISAQVCR